MAACTTRLVTRAVECACKREHGAVALRWPRASTRIVTFGTLEALEGIKTLDATDWTVMELEETEVEAPEPEPIEERASPGGFTYFTFLGDPPVSLFGFVKKVTSNVGEFAFARSADFGLFVTSEFFASLESLESFALFATFE